MKIWGFFMRVIFFFIVLLGLASCNGSNNDSLPNTISPAQDSINKEPLYPYPQYIQDQIKYVDSTPLAIELHIFENGVRLDSSIISRERFHELAAEFLQPDLNSSTLRPQYEEKSFQDLTINSVTFSITAKNKDLPLQQADILLNPETKKVKNIILKKQLDSADSSETKTLFWVHNRNFQILSTVSKKGGPPVDRAIKVIWDKPMF